MSPDLAGLRYRPSRGALASHVESWFFKANDPGGQRALWGRATILVRPGIPPCAEAWAVAFDRAHGHVAVKSTTLLEAARFAADRLDVEVDGCALSLEHARGALASGRGSIAWDLAIGPALAEPIVHLASASRAFYRAQLPPSMKLVTPLADARASGTVTVGRGGAAEVWSETWNVDGWPLAIGHNWGKRHAELYAWVHGNAWDVPGLVFEAVSGRVRIGPMLSPMATAAFVRWRGKSFDLARPRALATSRGLISLRRWEMVGEDAGVRVTCEVAAETDDMVGLHYLNPNGTTTFCLNSELARARLELGLPHGEKITATSRAVALEIGTLESEHGVRMYL